MDSVDRGEAAWEPGDYLTSLDRFFEFDAMDEPTAELPSGSFVTEWNLKRAA